MLDYCDICGNLREEEKLGICPCGNNYCTDGACGTVDTNECSICIDPVSCVGDED